MSTDHIVALLIAERDRLNRAIEALQGPTKRRGRPPKSALVVAETPAVPSAGKPRTAAQKKAQAKRMKEIWAKKKAEAAS